MFGIMWGSRFVGMASPTASVTRWVEIQGDFIGSWKEIEEGLCVTIIRLQIAKGSAFGTVLAIQGYRDVAEILETLATLGRAHQHGDGRFSR